MLKRLCADLPILSQPMTARMLIACVLLVGLFNSAPAEDEDAALFTIRVLTLEAALELAQAGLDDCRKRGYQVAVAVVDRFGNVQVTLRDRFAGPHTPQTAARKAWTAVSFRTDSLSLAELTRSGAPASGIRHVGNALMVGGGRTVDAEGSIVAGIGISGGPSGAADDACAQAAIEALTERLM
ncbi:MAG: GlcG/HbpS family heme-binding protein [Gammaproteobacteria bacterium]